MTVINKLYDCSMEKEGFQKEERVLHLAMKSLERNESQGQSSDPAFTALVKGYNKLLRQSRRLISMGDRMQQSLTEVNRNLEISEERYRGIFENVTEGVFRCGSAGEIVEANSAMAVMFGYSSPVNFLGVVNNIRDLFCHEIDFSRYMSLLVSGEVHRMEAKVSGLDGVVLWAEISACVMREESEVISCGGVVGILADVTERKHMTEEMCRLARTDSLTGLWNRGYFMELALREVARSKRSNKLSLLIVDADYFKGVNDAYGHDVGDKALVAMSRALLDSVREVDVVGRLGGEEFVVLLPDATASDACCVAERILEGVRQIVVDSVDNHISMTVSVGVASMEDIGDTLDGLLKFADIALYAAKKNGRDRAEVYRRSSCSCNVEPPVFAGESKGDVK